MSRKILKILNYIAVIAGVVAIALLIYGIIRALLS